MSASNFEDDHSTRPTNHNESFRITQLKFQDPSDRSTQSIHHVCPTGIPATYTKSPPSSNITSPSQYHTLLSPSPVRLNTRTTKTHHRPTTSRPIFPPRNKPTRNIPSSPRTSKKRSSPHLINI